MNSTIRRRWVAALPARSEPKAKGHALGQIAATGDNAARRKGAVLQNTGSRSFDHAGAPLGLRAFLLASPRVDAMDSGPPMEDIVPPAQMIRS